MFTTTLGQQKSKKFLRIKWTQSNINQFYVKNFMVKHENITYFDRLLYFLNGPFILLIVIVGLILNINTIIILYQKVIGKDPGSSRVVTMLTKQFVALARTCTKDTLLGKVCNFMAPKKKAPKIYIYFLWLTCTDTMVLISSFFMYSMPILLNAYNSLYAYLIPFWYMMCHFTTCAGVLLTLALVLERYRARRLPANAEPNSSDQKTTLIILIIITSSAFVVNLPRFFEATVKYDYANRIFAIRKTILLESRMYIIFYRILGCMLFYSTLPYVITFFLSFKRLKKMHSSSLERTQIQGFQYSISSFFSAYNPFNDTENMHIEKIFLAISFKFLIFRLTSTSLDIIEQILGVESFVGPSIALLFVTVNNLQVIISSALNFFIFWHYSKRFKKATGRHCYNVLTCNGYLSWSRIFGWMVDFTV